MQGTRWALAGFIAAATAAAAQSPSAPVDQSDDAIYDTAKALFDQYAPPEAKEQYAFPSKEEFNQFLTKLQNAIDGGSLEDFAQYEPQARAVLAVMRTLPDYAQYADWLDAKLDELDAATEIVASGPRPPSGSVAPPAAPPGRPAPARLDAAIPYYDSWLARVRNRPAPSNAGELMPGLESAFAAEGVPPELAWIAEAESSLRTSAQSPSGARGLFQLKAATAHDLGLSTFLPDDRTNPEKSAHAAARQLRTLGRRFGSWPLAIAAYNAGEGRVSRLLAAHDGRSFADVAGYLSGETRMYVPKVCALVAVRSGVTPDRLPAPR